MISVPNAIKIILANTRALEKEKVCFFKSLHRILAQDIRATIDLPPFDRSTRDGFALNSNDTKGASKKRKTALKVIGCISAGVIPVNRLNKGEAFQIATGALIPKGADAVIMKEEVNFINNEVLVSKVVQSGDNIFFKGEDARNRELLIAQGSLITSAMMGLFATLGLACVLVYRKPKVAILTTGDELLRAGAKLKPAKVRSANEYALCGLTSEAGAQSDILGIAKDNIKDLKQKIKKGLRHDVLLISGGVSVGEFDLVPQVLKELGARIYFHKVAIQPGKPFLFCKIAKTHVFGLPGNPVSTMISFYKFVRPCLLKMSGRNDFNLPCAKAILDTEIRFPRERLKIFRGLVFERAQDLYVRLAREQTSGNILSMAKANCIFEIKEGVTRLKKGQELKIQYLPR